MNDEQVKSILSTYNRLRRGLLQLSLSAEEQEASEPDFVCLSFELMDEIESPLLILRELGATKIVDETIHKEILSLRDKLVSLASNPTTSSLQSVRSSPAWESARSDARKVLRDHNLKDLDEVDIQVLMGWL